MNKSTITIEVATDENKIPDAITWSATDSSAENGQKAKAMMISFWDSAEKAALRIDLWTKDMMVDEIADFFYQTMMTMADTYVQPDLRTAVAASPAARSAFDLERAGHRVYVVDPQDRIILRYVPDADPRGILKDMERLLRYAWSD